MAEEKKEETSNSSGSNKTWMEVFQGWIDKNSEISLTEGYCLLDNGLNAYHLFNNRENYQINCFLVPNFLRPPDRFNIDYATYLPWEKSVTSLTIRDQLFSFGTSGTMEVADVLNSISHVLEQFVSYDLVINIIHKLDDERIIRFEPYVMSIVNIQEVAKPDSNTKILQIEFEDILTAEAKKHNLGSLLKFDPTIKQSQTFMELFTKIFDYLTGIISKNAGGKITYGKKIKMNTYKSASNQNSLIEPIFDDLTPGASIFELLTETYKSACVDITIDTKLTNDFEMIGNVLMPLFFKEEYPDVLNYYYNLFLEKPEELEGVSTNKEGIFVPRPFTLRNFYSPFQYGFDNTTKVVFESFTTVLTEKQTDKLKMVTINGENPLPISNIQALTSNSNLTTKRWKNLAFISANPQGGSNRLVYFNWIYEFFNKVFLRGKLNQADIFLSNITPAFYMSLQGNKSMQDDKDLAERNANIIMIKNEKADPLNEILMQIGKSIASLVFLNNMYSFEAEGSLLRRPNEIINLYTPQNLDLITTQSFRTDFTCSDNVILYATSVIHKFEGNTFTDKIICNRIYEKASSN